MRIYQINECDWFAAKTLEDAIECAKEFYGEDALEDGMIDDPKEISEEYMNKLTFYSEDTKETISFREQLNKMIATNFQFPTFFASSEY